MISLPICNIFWKDLCAVSLHLNWFRWLISNVSPLFSFFIKAGIFFCTTQCSDTQMVYNSMLTINMLFLKIMWFVGLVTAIDLFANRHIVFETIQWKPIRNWFVKIHWEKINPNVFFCVLHYSKYQNIANTQLRIFESIQWKNYLK